MDKIAIISDIHGNYEALKTVINDIENKGIKRIFCLGDIIGKGSHPKECIDLVFEKCEIIIQGNLECFVCSKTVEEQTNVTKSFYIKQLGNEYINKINNLAFCHEMYISGSLIRLFHASPTSVFDRINPFDNYKNKIKAFYPSNKTLSDKNADIVIFGDLHIQLMEKFYNKTLINTGSVGCSNDIIRNEDIDSNVMEITQAFYLIVEGEIDSNQYDSNLSFNFVRVPYDIDKELNTKNETLDKDSYISELKKGIYRDMKTIKEKYNID